MYLLPNALPSWSAVERLLLLRTPDTFSSLSGLLQRISSISQPPSFRTTFTTELTGLRNGITAAERVCSSVKFFEATLPFILAQARALPELFPDGRLSMFAAQRQGDASLSLTRQQAMSLLAHQFLGTLTPFNDQVPVETEGREVVGACRCHAIFTSHAREGQERSAAFILYFHSMMSASEKTLAEHVIYQRSCLAAHAHPKLEAATETVMVASPLHDMRMEDVQADALVDFANRDLMIGETIASATQEEILFSTIPELFPAILMMPRMRDNEAVVVANCCRLLEYTGYSRTFRLEHVFAADDARRVTVVAIDAHPNVGSEQYTPRYVMRDIVKAYVGFSSALRAHKLLGTATKHTERQERITNAKQEDGDEDEPTPGQQYHQDISEGERDKVLVIASGLWGCGVFGNNALSKYMQQCIAASLLGIQLQFCVYAQPKWLQHLQDVKQALDERPMTIATAYRVLTLQGQETMMTDTGFQRWLLSQISGAEDVDLPKMTPTQIQAQEFFVEASRLEEQGQHALAAALHRRAAKVDPEFYMQLTGSS